MMMSQMAMVLLITVTVTTIGDVKSLTMGNHMNMNPQLRKMGIKCKRVGIFVNYFFNDKFLDLRIS